MGARGVKGEQRERTGGWKSERRDERADTRVVRLPPSSLFSPLLAQVLKRTWLVCGRLTTSVGAVGGAPANGSNCEAAAGAALARSDVGASRPNSKCAERGQRANLKRKCRK